MDRFKLSEDEQRFVDNVSAAAAFDSRPDGLDEPRATIIRGELLRRILLKLPVEHHHSGAAFLVEVPTGCVELTGAEISGPVDLGGACAPDGGPLFGLRLENCNVSESLNLAGTNIRSVSLRGSKIVHLDASEATIVNSLDISGVRSAEASRPGSGVDNQPLCWADLRGARIGGSMIAANADLVGKPGRNRLQRFSIPASYALDLRGCVIADSVVLSPSFSALGGVSIAVGDIGNDVRAEGATLSAAEQWSFDANGARINGSFVMRGYDVGEDSQRETKVVGDIGLRMTKVKGIVDLSGATIEGGGVDAQNAEVGGDLLMFVWGAKGKAFVAEGRINLFGARIAGSLVLAGGKVKSVLAHNSEIGGNAMLGGFLGNTSAQGTVILSIRSMTGEFVAFDGAKISGSLIVMGVHLKGALSARNLFVGGSALFCGWGASSVNPKSGFEATEVLCDGAVIKGSLVLAGATLARDFGAQNIDIGGDAVLSGEFRAPTSDGSLIDLFGFLTVGGRANLEGARITGSLKLIGANIAGELIVKNADIGADAMLCTCVRGDVISHFSTMHLNVTGTCIAGNLDMKGAHIHRGISAHGVDVKGSVRLEPLPASNKVIGFEVEESSGEVSFSRSHIGGGLNVAGGRLGGSFEAVNAIIGANFQLCAWQDPDRPERVRLTVAGTVRLNGITVRGDADLTGCQIADKFEAKHAEIVGDVRLCAVEPNKHHPYPLPFESRSLDLTGARIGGTLEIDRRIDSVQGLNTPRDTDIYLVDTRVCSLNDREGMGWGEDATLRMQGFDYRRLDCKPGKGDWERRVKWLEKQYTEVPPNKDEYQPEPYQRLAQFYREDGRYDDADKITKKRLDIEREHYSFFAYRWMHWAFGFFFEYGLSPRRALATFLGFILLGTGAVWIADSPNRNPPRMVVNTTSVRGLAAVKGQAYMPAMQLTDEKDKEDKTKVLTGEIACGNNIHSWLYALDMFVPALGLHQEDKCTFASDASGWLVFKMAYAIFGWIVTAMTILTVSGILRRQQES